VVEQNGKENKKIYVAPGVYVKSHEGREIFLGGWLLQTSRVLFVLSAIFILVSVGCFLSIKFVPAFIFAGAGLLSVTVAYGIMKFILRVFGHH